VTGSIKLLVQGVANRFGFHIRRIDRNVSVEDAYREQVRLLKGEGDVVFEVGAFDGRDAVRYAELFPRAKVYAFEPVPESFALLQEKARQTASIVPINVALSDHVGTASFHLSNWVDASSLLRPAVTGSTFDKYQESHRTIAVSVDSIDATCERLGIDHIDLLKIDAQGAELRILKGAAKTLSKRKIRLIYVEVQFMECYEGAARFDQVMSELIGYGFRFHNLFNLNHNQRGELAWGDAIFVLA
jgi:FkbM family methyltransferase